VVRDDRPYSEIVTADYTLANRRVATVWGLPYSGSGEEWLITQWDDDRPSAGILSDSMLFTRHGTTFSNANRGRANAVSRALLCYDFLSREVALDSTIDLADPDEVNDAVRENDACASCHQTLDPLASYFDAYHPIYVPSSLDRYPVPHDLPTLEIAIEIRPSSYFGEPGEGLDFLGAMMASDPRFSLCAAKRFYAYFNQVPLSEVPTREAGRLQQVFIDSGLDAKALTKEVVLSDAFRLSHTEGETPTVGDAEGPETTGPSGLRKVRPWQLARLVADLTGFRWRTELPVDIGSGTIGEIDLMTDSLFGFDVLAGGIDSMNVTLPSHTMSASVSLVLRSLAARASELVVENDLTESNRERRHLLSQVSEATEDEASVRAQLVELELRIFGRRVEAGSPEIDDAFALFGAVLAESDDPPRAWQAVVFAMLQDVRVAYY
jgi:hypothetical protein